MSGRGRPSKLTKALVDKFEGLADSVACVDDAAAELNISPATYRAWLRKGLDADSRTLAARFREVALGSRIRQKNRLVSMLYGKAIAGDVSAAKYLLDRVHRMAMAVELSGPGGGPIEHGHTGPAEAGALDFTKLDATQLAELHAIVAAATVAEGEEERDADDTDTA